MQDALCLEVRRCVHACPLPGTPSGALGGGSLGLRLVSWVVVAEPVTRSPSKPQLLSPASIQPFTRRRGPCPHFPQARPRGSPSQCGSLQPPLTMAVPPTTPGCPGLSPASFLLGSHHHLVYHGLSCGPSHLTCSLHMEAFNSHLFAEFTPLSVEWT